MNIKLPLKAKKIIAFFKKHGFECFVVGGFIRDTLLERTSEESLGIDFATNATPPQMLELLPKAVYENRFGTVIVPLLKNADKLNLNKKTLNEKDYVEITTYRTEQSYSDSRHPDKVEWGTTLAEDLKRRDFTINALASDGTVVIDLFNGVADLNNKIIRAIGIAQERFGEDALRMMRAVRFAAELGFTIEKNTQYAMAKNAHLLSRISMERVRDEFFKILTARHAAEGVILLKTTGLLQLFMPELIKCFGVDQKSPARHHIYDVGTHLVKTLEACANPNPIVRLACLVHDIGKPQTRAITPEGVTTFYNHEIIGTEITYAIGKRLRLSKKQLILLTKLVRYHQFSVTEHQTDAALRRFIRNIGRENIQYILDLRRADRIGSGARATSWRTEQFIERLKRVQQKPFTIADLKIDGNDVMEILQLKPGREVGIVLKEIFQHVVEKNIPNDRTKLLHYLKTQTRRG